MSMLTAVAGDGSDEKLLVVRGLKKSYGRRRHSLRAPTDSSNTDQSVALAGVDLVVNKGEALGIVGETGSGKSTLGFCIVGLLKPDAGEIIFRGHSRTQRHPHDRLARARQIQIVFQDPKSSLHPRRRVGSILAEVIRVHRLRPQAEVHARVAELLELVGLPIQTAQAFPGQLSGGQRQRVAIARALAFEPDVIIADEVVSALDASVQAQILNLLADLQKALHLTLLFIAHNIAVVRYLCQRVVVVYNGQIVEEGLTEQVLSNPQHPHTKLLMDAHDLGLDEN